MLRKSLYAILVASIALAATACNTVQGAGRDIESIGRKGEEVIS